MGEVYYPMERLPIEKFEYIYRRFVPFVLAATAPESWSEEKEFTADEQIFEERVRTLICAFNRVLSGTGHPQYEQACHYLNKNQPLPLLEDLRHFLLDGIECIRREIAQSARSDAEFESRLNAVFKQLSMSENEREVPLSAELFWQLFFPEGQGILKNKAQAEEALRRKRTVRITRKVRQPIQNPAAEILFTSNVLLTVPLKKWNIDDIDLPAHIKRVLKENKDRPQEFWYDHPVPVGMPSENNEVLYGLRGLDAMMAFEKEQGNVARDQKLTVVLSCSVTHSFLQKIAKDYVSHLLRQAGRFEHLRIYLFTEQDVRHLVDAVLGPAWHVLSLGQKENDRNVFDVLGVDGPYGRHYSFLKAIALFWQTFIDPEIKATFKIDLDQVFDQQRLVRETGHSALEHFKTALWGAQGQDATGRPVHLGMIAGALVNADDIEKSLFTPDVPYPSGPQHADEFVFFSRLPQALSTRAEMMTRYDAPPLDGHNFCLQRVHVTGGTNGILIDALTKFKPFTPSFMGRAEDQAYLLSTMSAQNPQLGYVHKDGLIMRHDKKLFAQEAIRAAEVGKTIGDYERILYFSAYARALNPNYRVIKERLDPFTGCFISAIPQTIVYLRFIFKLLDLLNTQDTESALEFIRIGINRLQKALTFCQGAESQLKKQLLDERKAWDIFYKIFEILDTAPDAKAIHDLKSVAQNVVSQCEVT